MVTLRNFKEVLPKSEIIIYEYGASVSISNFIVIGNERAT
jgi:hypothetical protein